ncbi:hypothetical protein DdX_22153 [Ditylenchus destructor]|uniref:Uncharacterized protein n=1 Tax=Ditylenchus destructor TaxID=166010 RepID=A0AAD4MER7_9BILA|nr:hypothetical protein DdX_22153 [Ditylenchus destructor]
MQIRRLLKPTYGIIDIKYRDNRDSHEKITSIDVAVPKSIKERLETNLGGKQETQYSYTSLIPDFDGKITYDDIVRPGMSKEKTKAYKGTSDDAKSHPIVEGDVLDIKDLTGLTIVQVR